MPYENDFISSRYEWPYPIRYDVESDVQVDVLVIGGGVAGCWAAISAARRGAKVALVEKAATIKSGCGGTGCDHYQCTTTNPASKVSPEELAQAISSCNGEWINGITYYIQCRESYNVLLELEKMGAKIRDTGDEFKDAPFRDEKTKFLFAYDYTNKYVNRVWGTTFKPAMYGECRRLGVKIYDRVMGTSLLTEEGRLGAKVVGGTGLNVRTGEFFVFTAKAVVICTSRPGRLWIFSTEYAGLYQHNPPPSCASDGAAMAWRAGAEFTLLEKSHGPIAGSFGYPFQATGSPANTWYACSIVDANGKEIPWVDRDGNTLLTVEQRSRPAQGQKFFVMGGGLLNSFGDIPREFRPPRCILSLPDFGDRIEKGEFVLPLYADLPSMPEHERRAIFGLMVGQEGASWIVYRNLTRAGFDPDKDLLQNYQMMIRGPRAWRELGFNSGGLVVDWDLKTNLEGLYAAGSATFGSEDWSNAATSGRWAGAKAADYALKATAPIVDRGQVEKEKKRVYAPIERRDGINWKELSAGISRIMQEWCGEMKSEELLKIGLIWLKELREGEASTVYARNPHELSHAVECYGLLDTAEMIMHQSLARKASSKWLGFCRLDYPQLDPPEWHKFITIKLDGDKIKTEERPIDYWLQPPNAVTLKENYDKHKPW